MELLQNLFDSLVHFDTHLNILIQNSGLWIYFILFAVIFTETGFVVMPFLPGDSLLFVLGAFAAQDAFNPVLLTGILMLAAILGDSVNYAIGKYLGSRMVHPAHSNSGEIHSKRLRFLKKERLDRTHHFYKKYGGKTIVLARFIPIVRTFAPFVAGIVRMNYAGFFIYNVAGGILWVAIFVIGGFYFGNIPLIKDNFSFVTLLIIAVSIIPVIAEFIKAKSKIKKEKDKAEPLLKDIT
jgi:membrane-associated protein